MPLRVDFVIGIQEDPRFRLPFRRGDLGSGFTLSNDLAIFDATECAVCSSFLSAMIEDPQSQKAIAVYVPNTRWPQLLAEHDASASYSAACCQQIEHIGVLAV